MECNGVLNFLYKTNFRKTQMLYLNYWYEIKNVEEKCQIRYRIGRNATPKLQNLLKKQQNLPPHFQIKYLYLHPESYNIASFND